MSIFKVISELKILRDTIQSLDVKPDHTQSIDAFLENTMESYSTKLEVLSVQVEQLQASSESDLISTRIKDIYKAWAHQEVTLSTLPSSPVKTANPTKKAFGSPVKLALEKENAYLGRVEVKKGLKNTLSEIFETPDYAKRKENLYKKTEQLLEQLQQLIENEKESIVKTIMEGQSPENRPLVEASINEFFNFLLEEGGAFEKMVEALQKKRKENIQNRLYPKNRSASSYDRESLLLNKKETPFFKELGEVATSPDYFFEFNEKAKSLSEYFMKHLSEDPARIAVVSAFHQQKKQGLRLVSLNKILAKEILAECNRLNQYVLYRENAKTNEKEYITAPLTELDDLDLIKLDDDNVASLIASITEKKSAKIANRIQDDITRSFEELPLDANIEGCISFFPIKTVEEDGKEKYTCLVTTSGEISKINGERSKAELLNLQTMLTSFAKELQHFEGYTFVYSAKEQPGMDYILEQMNKALSGEEELGKNQEGFDPNRGCAEKKFIAYLRELMLQNTKVEVLGSANRRIRLDNNTSEKSMKKTQEEKPAVNPVSSEADLYKRIFIELESESATTEQGQEKIKSLLQEGFNPEEYNPVLDKVGLAYNKSKPPVKKQIPALIKALKTKIDSYSAVAPTVSDAKAKPSADNDYIPCCTSCQTIKMAILTLFEIYGDMLSKKHAVPVKLHTLSRQTSGSQSDVQAFCPASPPPVAFRVMRASSSDAVSTTTTLTPEMGSLRVVAKVKPDDMNGRRSLFL
jgi:hypothetical protein